MISKSFFEEFMNLTSPKTIKEDVQIVNNELPKEDEQSVEGEVITPVIDPELGYDYDENEEEIEQQIEETSYVGKGVVECHVCSNAFFIEGIDIPEEMVCPVCAAPSSDLELAGIVRPVETEEVKETEVEETEENETNGESDITEIDIEQDTEEEGVEESAGKADFYKKAEITENNKHISKLTEGYDDLTVRELSTILQNALDKLWDYLSDSVIVTQPNSYGMYGNFIAVHGKGYVELDNINIEYDEDMDESLTKLKEARSIKESKFQSRVDRDINKYGKVSNLTMGLLKKEGFCLNGTTVCRQSINESSSVDDIEKSLTTFLKNKGYNVSTESAKNYIESAAQYISMSKEADDSYTLDTWYADTKRNYPEDLRQLSLKKSTTIDEAINVENEPDNEVLRGILLSRGNKKLTPKEQEVLDKYGFEALDYGGSKRIQNKNTQKYLYIGENARGGWSLRIVGPNSGGKELRFFDSRREAEASKIDIINLLFVDRDRYNKSKYNRQNAPKSYRQYTDRYKNRLDYINKNIEEIQQKIQNQEKLLSKYKEESEEWYQAKSVIASFKSNLAHFLAAKEEATSDLQRAKRDETSYDINDFAARRYSDDTSNKKVELYKELKYKLDDAKWRLDRYAKFTSSEEKQRQRNELLDKIKALQKQIDQLDNSETFYDKEYKETDERIKELNAQIAQLMGKEPAKQESFNLDEVSLCNSLKESFSKDGISQLKCTDAKKVGKCLIVKMNGVTNEGKEISIRTQIQNAFNESLNESYDMPVVTESSIVVKTHNSKNTYKCVLECHKGTLKVKRVF